MRIAIIGFLIFSTGGFSHHDDVGTATYKNVARVQHDGDFIEFSLALTSNCYQDPQIARGHVVGNVDVITEWINNHSANYEASLDYSIKLINVGRSSGPDYPHYPGQPAFFCPGLYFAQQEINIRLNKFNGEESLSDDVILSFFNDLQIITGPLNYIDTQTNSGVETKIISINKGIFDDTAEILRLRAKEKAKQKATRDFLAFLGPDYRGSWHLHSIEINDLDYGSHFIAVPFGGQIGNTPIFGPEAPILSTIKLEPLVISVDGIFVFYFDTTKYYLPVM